MKLVPPSFTILSATDEASIIAMLKTVELGARNCYKSEDKITEDSHSKIIAMLRLKKHESVLEHGSVTVRIVCSRAAMAQLTRHRIASYSIESQRYVSYDKGKFGSEITYVKPIEFDSWKPYQQRKFRAGLLDAEHHYMDLVASGLKAEDARGVLPNQTKTEIVVTMNLRAWRNFFQLRCDKHAQSEIRFLAKGLLAEFHKLMPAVYADLAEEYLDEA